MKEIIYLDTAVLHSYIAQNNHGLANASSHEPTEEITDSIKKEEGYHNRSSMESLFNTGKSNGIFQPGNMASEKAIMFQTETDREIISKQLHDHALEEFEVYLDQNKLVHELTDKNIEGKFIKLSDSFKFIDFDYLKKIIQPEKLIKLLFIQQEEEITKLKKELEKTDDSQVKATQKAFLKQWENNLKGEKVKQVEEFKYIKESLQYLSDVLPTTSFVKIRQVIAPLKENHLREKAKVLMFKYGENTTEVKATLIGKVTSRITTVEMPDMEKASLFALPKLLNGILHPLGLINIGDFIVTPIAIYFE